MITFHEAKQLSNEVLEDHAANALRNNPQSPSSIVLMSELTARRTAEILAKRSTRMESGLSDLVKTTNPTIGSGQ